MSHGGGQRGSQRKGRSRSPRSRKPKARTVPTPKKLTGFASFQITRATARGRSVPPTISRASVQQFKATRGDSITSILTGQQVPISAPDLVRRETKFVTDPTGQRTRQVVITETTGGVKETFIVRGGQRVRATVSKTGEVFSGTGARRLKEGRATKQISLLAGQQRAGAILQKPTQVKKPRANFQTIGGEEIFVPPPRKKSRKEKFLEFVGRTERQRDPLGAFVFGRAITGLETQREKVVKTTKKRSKAGRIVAGVAVGALISFPSGVISFVSAPVSTIAGVVADPLGIVRETKRGFKQDPFFAGGEFGGQVVAGLGAGKLIGLGVSKVRKIPKPKPKPKKPPTTKQLTVLGFDEQLERSFSVIQEKRIKQSVNIASEVKRGVKSRKAITKGVVEFRPAPETIVKGKARPTTAFIADLETRLVTRKGKPKGKIIKQRVVGIGVKADDIFDIGAGIIKARTPRKLRQPKIDFGATTGITKRLAKSQKKILSVGISETSIGKRVARQQSLIISDIVQDLPTGQAAGGQRITTITPTTVTPRGTTVLSQAAKQAAEQLTVPKIRKRKVPSIQRKPQVLGKALGVGVGAIIKQPTTPVPKGVEFEFTGLDFTGGFTKQITRPIRPTAEVLIPKELTKQTFGTLTDLIQDTRLGTATKQKQGQLLGIQIPIPAPLKTKTGLVQRQAVLPAAQIPLPQIPKTLVALPKVAVPEILIPSIPFPVAFPTNFLGNLGFGKPRKKAKQKKPKFTPTLIGLEFPEAFPQVPTEDLTLFTGLGIRPPKLKKKANKKIKKKGRK